MTRGESGGNFRGKGSRVCKNNYKGHRTIMGSGMGGWKWEGGGEGWGLDWGGGKRQRTVLE